MSSSEILEKPLQDQSVRQASSGRGMGNKRSLLRLYTVCCMVAGTALLLLQSATNVQAQINGDISLPKVRQEVPDTGSQGVGKEITYTDSQGIEQKATYTDSQGIEQETTYTDSQGVEYVCSEDAVCSVKSFAGLRQQTAVLPQEISFEGSSYAVTGIEPSAFQGCRKLKKLEIPSTVFNLQEGIFSGCESLTELVVIPAQEAWKRTENAMQGTVKISSVLFDGAEHVSIRFDEDFMEEAVAAKQADMVKVSVKVTGGGSEKDQGFRTGTVILTERAVKALADYGKGFQAEIREDGAQSCQVKVDAENLAQAAGELRLMLAQHRADEEDGTFAADYQKALRKNGLDAGSVNVFAFSFEGGARTNVEAVFPADGIDGAGAGSSVYVYRYEKTKRVFTALSVHPYQVTKQGRVKLLLSKGGVFAVSEKPFSFMSAKPEKGWLKEPGGTYYIGGDGEVCRGWKEIGGSYYYFDRKNGRMASSGKTDGIKLAKDGSAVPTKANIAKIQTMIKARKIVSRITKEQDSKSEKIETCFRWIFQFPYRLYRRLKPIYKQPGWEVTFANDIFDHQKGCCVSEASALAFLFHECGYETVYVACDTGHAWVELNGRVYDPLFAEARGFEQFYNVAYSDYGLRAVYKRKI